MSMTSQRLFPKDNIYVRHVTACHLKVHWVEDAWFAKQWILLIIRYSLGSALVA